MTESNVFKLNKSEQNDPMQKILREGARKMLATAIETEVSNYLEQHDSIKAEKVKDGADSLFSKGKQAK